MDRLIARAEENESRRDRDEVLIRARDEILAALRSTDDGMPDAAKSLLTFALLGAEHLSRTAATRRQLGLLSELVGAAGQGDADAQTLATFERRLREAGIEVLLSMPGASVAMAAHPDEADEEAEASGTGAE